MPLSTPSFQKDSAVVKLVADADLKIVIDTLPAFVWITQPNGAAEYLNMRWIDYTGMGLDEAMGWGWMAAIHPGDLDGLMAYWTSLLSTGKPGETEARLRRFDGNYLWFLFRVVPLHDEAGNLSKWFGTNIEIEEKKWTEALLAGESRILDLISKGQPLSHTLSAICRLVGELSPRLLCSVLLVDEVGYRFRHGAGPALPDGYNQAMDGGSFETCSSACARAARLGEQVIVPDIAADLVWQDGRELPLGHGLRACWSMPIFSPDRKVIGLFVIYLESPSTPTGNQLYLIAQLIEIASIAIERDCVAMDLRASKHLACGQLDALAGSLAVLSLESLPEKYLEHILRIATKQLDACHISVWELNQQTCCVELSAHYQHEVLEFPQKTVVEVYEDRKKATGEHPVWAEFFRTGNYCVHGKILDASPWAAVAAHLDGPWHDWRAAEVNNPMIPRMIQDIMASGVVATLNVPMFVAGRVAGFFTLHFKRTRTFRQDEIALTRAMANQALLAMQLYRLSLQNCQSAVIAERNRMAREIHDTLAQGFAGIIVQLDAASDAKNRELSIESDAHIARASELARDSLAEARRSVCALRPLALERETLPLALERMLFKMAGDSMLQVNFLTKGKKCDIPLEWEENLLRICQEALNNALSHAEAVIFEGSLDYAPSQISLELRDDGCGFDLTHKHHGFGLIGIRERVEEMAGELLIRRCPGQGTTVRVILTVG